MKLFSPKSRPPSRITARNATLLNLLATPGLGSLIGRRWIAGGGQLLLSISGFTLFMVWFVKEMTQFYGQISGNVEVRPVGKFLIAGVILFALAWVWSAVTSISLLREASSGKEQALKNFAAPPVQKLDEAKIIPALATVPDWKLAGATIVRTFQFKDFPAAIKFVGAVAVLAEQAWHHPDIDIRWNKVTLTLSTHDAGGLTEKDFALARQFDRL
ncbi:MAG: 4a-hydroxytetrahydrobiopterin dehydratase [Verrucomicrobiales bacterium]|nr:4a-hydroxytetrahydrobiopterin dehydratase [Verrucomicrobiales bacterium]